MSIVDNAILRMVANFTERSALDLGNADMMVNKAFSNTFTDGTGDDQVDLVFTDQRTINASSDDELDLYGSLTDAFGNTLNFAKVKVIVIKASAANSNNINIGGSASNPFDGPFLSSSDIHVLQPDGIYVTTAPNTGYTVTASTGDICGLARSAPSPTWSFQATRRRSRRTVSR